VVPNSATIPQHGRYSFANLERTSSIPFTCAYKLLFRAFIVQFRSFGTDDAVFTLLFDAIPMGNPLDRLIFRRHSMSIFSVAAHHLGWEYWTNQLTQCGTILASTQRIDVRTLFF